MDSSTDERGLFHYWYKYIESIKKGKAISDRLSYAEGDYPRGIIFKVSEGKISLRGLTYDAGDKFELEYNTITQIEPATKLIVNQAMSREGVVCFFYAKERVRGILKHDELEMNWPVDQVFVIEHKDKRTPLFRVVPFPDLRLNQIMNIMFLEKGKSGYDRSMQEWLNFLTEDEQTLVLKSTSQKFERDEEVRLNLLLEQHTKIFNCLMKAKSITKLGDFQDLRVKEVLCSVKDTLHTEIAKYKKDVNAYCYSQPTHMGKKGVEEDKIVFSGGFGNTEYKEVFIPLENVLQLEVEKIEDKAKTSSSEIAGVDNFLFE